MIFNEHFNLAGNHAFLSPSKPHWTNYEEEKLDRVFTAAMAAQRGTELHALAHNLIRLGVKLPRTRTTLNMYVNDALGFRMTPEQILYFSDACYGTADAISFRANKLRVSDLKTGVTRASHRQLEVYVALFCLEYRMKPFDIDIELRIYQNDDIDEFAPDPDDIMHIMDKITTFSKRLTFLREEAS